MRRKGTVRWFDEYSGEGMIRDDETKESFVVYACNIIGAKTAFKETCCMFLVKNEPVEYELHNPLGAIKVSGGHFDSKKWGSLDQDSLAFKTNDDGTFKNGLF